jgi:cold shock CspA family protein
MHEIIDNKIQKNASVVNNLFVNKEIPIFNPTFPKKTESIEYLEDNGAVKRSTIHSLKTGFGFIKFPPNNLFFHWSNMLETDFNDLHENDFVEFEVAKGEKGDDVAVNIRRLDPSEVNYTHGSVNGVNKAVATE